MSRLVTKVNEIECSEPLSRLNLSSVSVAKLATDGEIERFYFLVDMHVCSMAHIHHATWN